MEYLIFGRCNGIINDNMSNVALKVASSAVLGGTISEIGGGKFANGAVTGAYSMLFNDIQHQILAKKYQTNAVKQFIAIVVGEAKNTSDAEGIGSVMINRLNYKGAKLTDGFIDKIGGEGQYDAIGGKAYNDIMNSSWDEILNPNNDYALRIYGALSSLSGTDYSNGAYFWNASKPKTGFNWDRYYDGTYSITATKGGTTFFKYSNSKKTWP